MHVVRPSRGMPVSLLALGGLSVPPPDFYRSLRPRPDNKVGKVTQVNRAVVQESTHSERVSWFISCSPTQSLYPGRPRGGLTVFPSRHLSPDADLRNPEGLLCTCAPPRARSSCPTVPLSELPDPHLRMVEDFVSLARPLATALWPRPSSSSPLGFARPPLVRAPTALAPLVTSGIEQLAPPPQYNLLRDRPGLPAIKGMTPHRRVRGPDRPEFWACTQPPRPVKSAALERLPVTDSPVASLATAASSSFRQRLVSWFNPLGGVSIQCGRGEA